MRRTSLYQTGDIRRQRVRVTLNEEMYIVWLYCKPLDMPCVLFCDLFNNLLQTVMDSTNKYLTASLRAKHHVIQDVVNTVRLMYIFLFHVVYYTPNNVSCQHSISKGGAIHPSLRKMRAFWLFSCNQKSVANNGNESKKAIVFEAYEEIERYNPVLHSYQSYSEERKAPIFLSGGYKLVPMGA